MELSLAARPGIGLKARALGKMALYLILALIGAILATAVAKAAFGATLLDLAQRGTALGIVRASLLLIGTVVLPTALLLWWFKEPVRDSGWAMDNGARLLGRGLLAGFGLLAAMAAVLWLSGAVTFHLAAPGVTAALSGLSLSALLWLIQAAGEEGLHRGYAFIQLCRALSFWPAAVLSSAWFLYGHVGNPGETALGIAAAGLLGLALSYSLLETRSLWFALGFHAAWNFTQSFVFGFANSGGKPPVSLLSAEIAGSPLLTGGSAGPEGSLLVLPGSVALVVIIRKLARQRPEPRAPMAESPQPAAAI